MKTAEELRRDRRIGLTIGLGLLALVVIAWLTVKVVTGFSRVGSTSMAPTLHPRAGRVYPVKHRAHAAGAHLRLAFCGRHRSRNRRLVFVGGTASVPRDIEHAT